MCEGRLVVAVNLVKNGLRPGMDEGRVFLMLCLCGHIVDHPVDTISVGERAEQSPELLAEGHRDRGAGRKGFEDTLCFFSTVGLDAHVKIVPGFVTGAES